jgi:hypothetical protein
MTKLGKIGNELKIRNLKSFAVLHVSTKLNIIYSSSPCITGNTLCLRYRAQPVNAVCSISLCLLWEPYGTHWYTVCVCAEYQIKSSYITSCGIYNNHCALMQQHSTLKQTIICWKHVYGWVIILKTRGHFRMWKHEIYRASLANTRSIATSALPLTHCNLIWKLSCLNSGWDIGLIFMYFLSFQAGTVPALSHYSFLPTPFQFITIMK